MSTLENDRGLRLLSLDGGGIRGLSELLIIEEIMKRVQSQLNLQDIPRPAEYFDLIGGTSTGGLIAILLGRLGLSAGEAIEVYTRLAEKIFSKRKPKWKDGTFKATVLENEIKTVVGERLGPDRSDAKMLEDKEQGQGCKMFVCATPALNVAFPRRFRNYRVRRHEAHNCRIWEAGRATSAAPTFFKRIEIGGEQFVDAGLGCNNPIKEVIAEAQLVFGKEKKVDCIISIGTGKSGVVGFDKPTGFQTILPLDLVDVLRKMATESSKTAEEMEQRYEDATNFYFRFDVDQGLQDVGLDEWRQLGAVKTHTVAYTMETNINRKIDAVIGLLTGADSPKAYNLAQLGGQIFSTKGGSMSAKDRHLEPTFNVPFLRDLDFVDRADIMTQISKSFLYPGARVALLGFGGIGKSQLAIEYAHRARDASPQTWVFWVHASNQARTQESFEQIARILDLPGRKDPKANIFQIVGKWLKNTCEKWLLVVDNADDPIMFSKPAREEQIKGEKSKGNPGLLTFPPLVTTYLPHTQNGSILVTSRNEEASLALVGEDKNIIHVTEMNEKESLELLLKKLNEKVDRQSASDLVKALDYIPLAITQAAAFLSRQKGRVSISQYVSDLNTNNEKIIHLLKQEFVNHRRDQSVENSIIATWQISFEHIHQNWPSAARMLSLMSFFNYQAVPEFLLHAFEDPALGRCVNEDLNDDFEKRLQILRDYCLISLGEDNSTFRMHRLVQTSTQDWLKSHGLRERMWQTYVRIMAKAFRMASDDWETFRGLLPHIEAVHSQERPDEKSARDWTIIIMCVSHGKSILGESEEAEQISRNALESSERWFGEGHRATLTSLHTFGKIMSRHDKLEKAEESIRRALDGRQRLLGLNHSETRESMKELALVFIEQGQLTKAEELLRSVLEFGPRNSQKNNFFKLGCLNILARVLRSQERLQEAEELWRHVLASLETLYGEHNLDTLTVLFNLALVLMDQGESQEAEEILVRVLKGRETMLGPNAPDTISSRDYLAQLLLRCKKYKEADKVIRGALEEREGVSRKENPGTARYLNMLGKALLGQGNIIETEKILRQAIEVSGRTVGTDHPATIAHKGELDKFIMIRNELLTLWN